MRREKLAFLKIFITIGVLISLPVIIGLSNSSKEKHDIRSKAEFTGNPAVQKIPERIIYTPIDFQKINGSVVFSASQKPISNKGFIPAAQTHIGPQYTATIKDNTGHSLSSQTFPISKIASIDKLSPDRKTISAELKELAANSEGLTFPFFSNANYLEIKNPAGEVVKIVSIKNKTEVNNIINLREVHNTDVEKIIEDRESGSNRDSSKLLQREITGISGNLSVIKKAFAANGTFRIVVIGDNYEGNNAAFQKDANDIATGLFSVEPFKANKSNIVFYFQMSTVPLCTYNNSVLSCNDSLTLQQASSTPYDKIYVLYNGPYAGFAYLGSNLSYGTNAAGMAKEVKQALFIHELAGHALGGLMDEYSYGTTGTSYAPNCSDFPSCPSWNAITGLGCFSTCGFTNLYRPTDNGSVMNTALLNGILNFDAFSTQIVNGKLATFLGASPPTTTLAPSTPTPTITPSVTPSITPSITPSVTPSPTDIPASITPSPTMIPSPTPIGFIPSLTPYFSPTPSSTPSLTPTPSPTSTPTPTPTPTPSSTPTPSQIPGCTFPNFCTQTKYCETENILPISCNSNSQICCKFQEQPAQPPLNPQSVENTPTPIQRFEPLPTLTPKVSKTPTPTPTITTPIATIYPSFTPTPSVTRNIYPTLTAPPSLSPTLTTEIFSIPTIILPSPTKSYEVNYPVYSTPTAFLPENIAFERITPTPQPKVGFWNILSTPSIFINNLVKNFFSIFRRN